VYIYSVAATLRGAVREVGQVEDPVNTFMTILYTVLVFSYLWLKFLWISLQLLTFVKGMSLFIILVEHCMSLVRSSNT
jgi:hypothetical protein